MAEKEISAGGICEIEHQWIPMPDGVRLAARIWLPEGMPCPAILEYIPYRKRDMVRARDERNHPYFAAHGYACLRVDMRGSGDSEGVMPDMYDENELADARHVIDWIAAQPWCNGRVGMFGTSWGGTASLQAAVDAPGPLKAVLANCATIDRFEDDIHWKGGCLLTDTLEWGAALPAILAAPPDAATVGEGWWEMWQDRLKNLTHPLEAWMRHKTRGDYWRHGSIRFATDRISCPILSIGGWADRYSNSVMPLVTSRPDLCWGIVGPWGHHYPDHGEPGPAISFQDVALDWWDHWLKPETPEPALWPKLRLWRRRYDKPQDRLAMRSGEWIELDSPADCDPLALHLTPDGLSRKRNADNTQRAVPFDIRHGAASGDTGYFGRMGGLPLEQSADDALVLVFETAPLEENFDLVGHVRLSAEIIRAAKAGQLICRICDVAPDGSSNLVTRAIRNLELDEMLDAPRPFAAGRGDRYEIVFPTTAYRFAKGHRIRLALGGSYWPLVWPSGSADPLQVSLDRAMLELPTQPDKATPLRTPFPVARPLPESPSWQPVAAGSIQRHPQDICDGTIRSAWHQPASGVRFPDEGLEIVTETSAQYSLPENNSGNAICQTRHVITIRRPDGCAEVVSEVSAESMDTETRVKGTLSATWNGTEQTFRKWTYDI